MTTTTLGANPSPALTIATAGIPPASPPESRTYGAGVTIETCVPLVTPTPIPGVMFVESR